MPIRVMIADDHQVVREGLKQILELETDLEVVGLAVDGQDCLDLLSKQKADVIYMDLRMPRLNGIEATRRISREHPEVKVIILTVYDDEQYLLQAIQAGAKGFVLKDADDTELVRVIREVNQDRAVLDPVMLTKHLATLRRGNAQTPGQHRDLTRREQEVLGAIARGLSDKQIGDNLNISEHTVRTHIKNIFRKLGVATKSQAAAMAINQGLVELD